MRLGAHLSIAKGFVAALDAAVLHGCQSVQIFVANPRSWSSAPISSGAIEAFRAKRRELAKTPRKDVSPVVAHMPYLPNLSSTKPDFLTKSRAALADNLERCAALGVEYLVVHMGKHENKGLEAALERMAAEITRVLSDFHGETTLLLENTAGQGTETGSRMEEIGRVLAMLPREANVGVCLDTCHLFAAGYDLTDGDALERLAGEIETHLGDGRVRVLHLNDSRKPCGSHVDRHAHIGQGCIGEAGFRRVLTYPAFRALPGIIETPQEEEGDIDMNLNCLRRCLGRKARTG